MTAGCQVGDIACKPRAFREEHLNHADSKWRVGRWWDFTIGVLVPVQAVVLFVWMLIQAMGWEEDWLNPFGITNVGTVLFQVGLVASCSELLRVIGIITCRKVLHDVLRFPP